jgi:2,3-dihydroxybiphenyl 1,2-dioxygenase
MMDVALGYLSIGVTDTRAWETFAREFLAVDASYPQSKDGDLLLRMDDHAFRYLLRPSGEDDLRELGWEVATRKELDKVRTRLDEAGVSYSNDGAFDAADVLGAADALTFVDPDGLRSIVYTAPALPKTPVHLPKPHGGFVTGNQGAGHMVLASQDLDRTTNFYQDVLGFRISDYITLDKSVGSKPVVFMHCNPRHHTLAYFEGSTPKRLNHIMFQCNSFDDVGIAMDVVKEKNLELVQELGKHSNDHMVSIYAITPSGFEVEYGWGGRAIDDSTWTVATYDHISKWGHQRLDGRW